MPAGFRVAQGQTRIGETHHLPCIVGDDCAIKFYEAPHALQAPVDIALFTATILTQPLRVLWRLAQSSASRVGVSRERGAQSNLRPTINPSALSSWRGTESLWHITYTIWQIIQVPDEIPCQHPVRACACSWPRKVHNLLVLVAVLPLDPHGESGPIQLVAVTVGCEQLLKVMVLAFLVGLAGLVAVDQTLRALVLEHRANMVRIGQGSIGIHVTENQGLGLSKLVELMEGVLESCLQSLFAVGTLRCLGLLAWWLRIIPIRSGNLLAEALLLALALALGLALLVGKAAFAFAVAFAFGFPFVLGFFFGLFAEPGFSSSISSGSSSLDWPSSSFGKCFFMRRSPDPCSIGPWLRGTEHLFAFLLRSL